MLEGIELSEHDGAAQVTASYLDAPVRLQDELEILPGGQFRFIGRGSDMLNIGGKRASLVQLNRELLLIDGVDDGVIFPGEKRRGEERLAALVVSELEEREILRRLAQVIDPVFLPRPLQKVVDIPRNSVGKSTRAMLLAALRPAGRGSSANAP